MLIQRLAGRPIVCVFFFNDTATTEIYTLSLHDALPILLRRPDGELRRSALEALGIRGLEAPPPHLPREDLLAELQALRSEEHTSELQSRSDLVCRLLLEKKKQRIYIPAVRRHAMPYPER